MRKPKVNLKIKKMLDELENLVGQDMEVINIEISKVIKAVTGEDKIAEGDGVDFIDEILDNYTLLYELAYNNKNKIKSHSKLYDYIDKYGGEKYGEEILNEIGFTIIGRTENGSYKIKKIDEV